MNPIGMSILLIVAIVVIAGAFFGLTVLIRRRRNGQGPMIVETGLKAVDLFAPILVGSDVLLSGDPRAGVRVLATELAYRLAMSPQHPFRVIIYLDSELDDIENVCKELRETLSTIKQIFISPSITSADIQEQRSGLKFPTRCDIRDHPERTFCRRVSASHKKRTPSIPIRMFFDSVYRNGIAVPGRLRNETHFVRLACQRGDLPVLDLRFTLSIASTLSALNARSQRVANSMREAVIELLENLYPGALNDVNWRFNSDPTKRAAVQALRFMSQPYFTAEPYTGLKAQNVSIRQSTKAFESILSGRFLEMPPKAFQFQNDLKERG